MTQAEIEAVLLSAFGQCESAGVPLGMEQREILLQALSTFIYERLSRTANAETQTSDRSNATDTGATNTDNPLDELTKSQRQALLNFVRQETAQNRSWKVQLLNDWLQGQDSGAVQFVRELYGVQWLERVQPNHLAQYEEAAALQLHVGDRIEVSNSLWEWVQEEGPCSREWFPCTVVAIRGMEAPSLQDDEVSCTIRFDNGMEYELQGVYDWNSYNWRWAGSQ